jgi:hypothetical protein
MNEHYKYISHIGENPKQCKNDMQKRKINIMSDLKTETFITYPMGSSFAQFYTMAAIKNL